MSCQTTETLDANPPVYPSTYQAADAAVLQPVAAQANGDVMSINFIPGGWTIIKAISDGPSGIQALLLTNTLPSNPDQTFLVLALGQTWRGFLQFFSGQGSGQVNNYALAPLASSLSGQPMPSQPIPPTYPNFSGVYQNQYVNRGEAAIFAVLSDPGVASQVAGLPLIVVGQAIGAPTAQLAALGFLSSRSGIPGNIHTAACYTFSTPPMGDTNFSSLLTSTIPASFNVYAASVDFFAAPLTPFANAVRCGVPQSLAATVPTLPELNNQAVDDSWREHSGAFYTGLLTTPQNTSTTPGTLTGAPSTYSNDLAKTLTLMIAVVYQQTQHPNAPSTPALSGFNLEAFLASNGTRWGAIFSDMANKRIFVVFRGEISLEESVNALTQMGVTYPSYLPNWAALAPGMDQIYSGLRASLRTAATAALAKVGGTGIVVAGHGVGGTVANICALDFATQGGGFVAPTGVYTFGAPPSGDPSFQSQFNALFATSSPTNFQLTRSGDPFPILQSINGGPLLVGTNVTLNGGSPYDDYINHSLTSFIALLN